MRSARLLGLALSALLIGCATLATTDLRTLFGPADPTRFDHPAPASQVATPVSFEREVKPILDARCVVCHACYDAPCQLKLSSWEGLTRGASKQTVYDAERLVAAEPSRLYIDADTPSEWRKKGFHPVLNEFADRGPAETQASTLARMLELKARHPLTPDEPVNGNLDFSLDRAQQCARTEEFDDFERKYPQWGMPFGLPALSEQETSTIRRWLQQGAPYAGPAALTPAERRQIEDWERFLNGDALQMQLASRYIYEHLFLAHLYFAGHAGTDQMPARYFRLVRSSTPPGQPLREIASRRPFDDPGVARVYYRLRPELESISAKSHMPYALSPARMARWTALFLQGGKTITQLPSYDPEIASNPFLAFRDLPVDARYRFMLDEAQFTIMGFIKGPVCRGQTALNVINDHFWVFFQDPDAVTEDDASFLQRESRKLALPAEHDSTTFMLSPWLRYSTLQHSYLQAKSAYYAERFKDPTKVNLAMVWNGEGRNDNAALTVYRHFDSATVLKGLEGETPKTAWIFSYSLLERVHYLLVAGYDVFGNIGHQFNTRLYMDFLRMESEFNFLSLLPQAERIPTRDRWYRMAPDGVKDLVYGKYAFFAQESGIRYQPGTPADRQLMAMLRTHLKPVLHERHARERVAESPLRQQLDALSAVRGAALQWLPEQSLLRIEDPGLPARTLSLLRNTAHLNVTHLLSEHRAVVPAEYTLDVLDGFVGAYPNAIFRLRRAELPAFTAQLAALKGEKDYTTLMSRFGVRRSSPAFWPLSDALHADYRAREPITAGLLDYNRLENR